MYRYNEDFFPQTGYTPPLIVNLNISAILGFLQGVYPSVNTINSFNILSYITPNARTLNSIVIRSNIINNECCMLRDILDCFSINNSSFGEKLYTHPFIYEKWVNVKVIGSSCLCRKLGKCQSNWLCPHNILSEHMTDQSALFSLAPA